MVKKIKDPGFGHNSYKNAKSIIDKKGISTVIHKNRKFRGNDLFSFFIELSWSRFFLFVFLGYTVINVIFGCIYVLIGIEQITPATGIFFKDFLNGFFFSAQTLTTVGYGGISPVGTLANIIAAFEAMIGLLSFSFITGLLYGRFSKPKASIKFSNNLILRDFNNGRALMFRLMNSRKTVMIEPEIKVTLSITKLDENNEYKRSFHELELERNSIMYLPTAWTIVHQIDEKSPLYTYSDTEISKLDAELYIITQYHEEAFGQKVYQLHSYDFLNLQIGVQYVKPSYFNNQGFTVLDHQKLNQTEKII